MEILTEIHQITTWQLALFTAIVFFYGVFMQMMSPHLIKKLEDWVKDLERNEYGN